MFYINNEKAIKFLEIFFREFPWERLDKTTQGKVHVH